MLNLKKIGFAVFLFFAAWAAPFAQICPVNIDFESGTFDGWKCYTGSVINNGGVHQFVLNEEPGPIVGRHTIIPSFLSELDYYGGFSTNSPNASGYSIKLGNDLGGGEGEAISYEFTIPANRDTFSLIYYYAVVFQDPNHEEYEQPRMEIEINNVTDNSIIPCASFTFIPFGTGLPGFFESPVPANNSAVWCKDWTPVTINLNGNAGKTIRLTFRTGDCTFRRHFGYAYIDVDTDCSGEFLGASYCPEDAEVTISAPFGFQDYVWFNSDMSRQIGTGPTLTISPPPATGTTVNVRLTPYDGYGCPQTLTTRLINNLLAQANAGKDTVSCNLGAVRIGSAPRHGLEYRWSPEAGLSNPQSSNPFASPLVTTNYIVTAQSPGGGCFDSDTVRVIASNLGNSMQVLGRPQYCIESNDSAVLQVEDALVIRWYKNNQLIPTAISNRYKALETGDYNAFLQDQYGCSATTPMQVINISSLPKAIFSLDSNRQCLVGNRFSFSNSSTNVLGTMQYRWDFGGTGFSTSVNPVYTFPVAGQLNVKLIVRTNDVCADSLNVPVTIDQNPIPLFDANAICVGLPFLSNNLTDENIGSPIHYAWIMDGSPFTTQRNPPATTFNVPGTHEVMLNVYSDQCPLPVQTLTKTFQVEEQSAGKRYPIAFALRDFPLPVEARKIGVTARWLPSSQLSDANIYSPVFRGTSDRQYTITLVTQGGCTTVDTLLVQIVEKAEIMVPTAFTPNGDGLNDFLRPVPLGVKEIRYFKVFNRWGQLVYDSRAANPLWDGTVKGMKQASQSYIWMAEGVSISGEIITRKGTSVLIR